MTERTTFQEQYAQFRVQDHFANYLLLRRQSVREVQRASSIARATADYQHGAEGKQLGGYPAGRLATDTSDDTSDT
jgi:hypothetical protein